MLNEIHIQSMGIRKQQAQSELVHYSEFPLLWNSPLQYWYISNKGIPAFNITGLFALDY